MKLNSKLLATVFIVGVIGWSSRAFAQADFLQRQDHHGLDRYDGGRAV